MSDPKRWANVAGPAPRLGLAEQLAVFGALVVCALVVVLSVGDASFALHNDGPQYAFAAEVHARYRESALGWGEIYRLHWPTTVRGPVELHLLARALGASPGLAHTLVLDFVLLAWVGAFFLLVLRLCPGRWPLALFGLTTAFQLSFELGVLPFYLGLSGALLVVALEVGARRSSVARDALLMLSLFLIARAHVLPAALAGVFVVAIRAAGDRPVRDLGAAVVAGLPALLLAIRVAGRFAGGDGPSGTARPSWDGVVALARDFLPGEPWRGAVALVIVIGSLGLLIHERRRRTRREIALGVVAAIFLVAAALSPEDLGGWQLFRPRLLPLSFAVLLALLPVERLGVRARALASALLLVVGVSSALAARAQTGRWERIFRPVIEGMRQAPAQPRAWAAVVTVLDEPVPKTRITPWLHLGQLVALELGGRPAYMQDDDPAVHSILARVETTSMVSPPFPGLWPKAWAADLDGERHFEVVRAFAAWGLAVDGLVVYGRPDDREALQAGGQDVTFARELAFDRTVYATTSVGCDIDVAVSGPSEPVLVSIGFTPGESALDVTPADGASGIARFRAAPCGSVWVEVDGARCEGADAKGRLRAFVDRGEQPARIACDRPFDDPTSPQ